MVSFNNATMKRKRDADREDVYALRKLSVGVGSVLLGTMLYAGVSGPVHADVLPASGSDSNSADMTSAGNAVAQTAVGSSAVQSTVQPTSDSTVASPVTSVSTINSKTAQVSSTVSTSAVNEAVTDQSQPVASVLPSSSANATSDFQIGRDSQSYHVSANAQPAADLDNYQITRDNQNNYQVGFNHNQSYSGNVTLPNLADVQQKYQDAQHVTFDFNSVKNADVSNVTSLNISNTNNQKLSMPEDLSHSFSSFTNLKNLDLSNADSKNVTNLDSAFANLQKLQTINLTNWNTKNVSDVKNLFANDRVLSQIKGVENWNLSNAASFEGMLSNTQNLNTVDFSNVKTSDKLTSLKNMFNGSGISSVDFSNTDLNHVRDAHGMFANTRNLQTISGLNVEKTDAITDVSDMFKNSGLKSVDMNWFSGRNVANMSGMLSGMTNLSTIDNLKDFGYRNSESGQAKVETLAHFIDGDYQLANIDLSGFDNTVNLTDLTNAFSNAGLTALDISYLNPVNVVSMKQLAYNDSDLTMVALGKNFNAKSVQNLQQAFANDPKLTTFDLSNFQTGDKEVNAKQMFSNNEAMTSLSGLRGISADKSKLLEGVNPNVIYGVSLAASGTRTALAPAWINVPIHLVDLDYQEGMKDQAGNLLKQNFDYFIGGEAGTKVPSEINSHIPAGYKLAPNKDIWDDVIVGDSYTMYLVHDHQNTQATKDVYFNYNCVAKDPATGKETVLHTNKHEEHFGYTVSKDLVTGQTSYLHFDDVQVNEFPAPTIAGYTLTSDSPKSAPAVRINPDTPTQSTVTFYYTPVAKTQVTNQVQFVDDDYHAGDKDTSGKDLQQQVVTYTLSGDEGSVTQLNINDHIPANYQLAPNMTYPTSIELKNGNAPVVIHLVHKTDSHSSTLTFQRSIVGVADDQSDPLFSQSQTQGVTFNSGTDLVTGKKFSNFPAGVKFNAFPLPDEPGYSVENNMTSVPETQITADTPTTTTVRVNYHRAEGTYTINFVDDDYQAGMKDKGGNDLNQNIGFYSVNGKTGAQLDIELAKHIPSGYMLIPGVEYPSTIVLDKPQDSTTLHLIHAKTTTPVTQKYHRDIKGVADDQKDPLFSANQDATVTYNKVEDQLTGKITNQGFPEDAAFPEFTLPDVSKYGYATDDGSALLPSIKITADTPINSSQIVHYHKVVSPADVEIKFVDLDNDSEALPKTATVHTSKGQSISLQQYLDVTYPNYVADEDQNQMQNGQLAPYQVGDGASQSVTVYVRHKIDRSDQKREIHRRVYTIDPITNEKKLVEDQVITATRSHIQDMADPSQEQTGDWQTDGFLPEVNLSKYAKVGYKITPDHVDALSFNNSQINNLKAAADGKYYVDDVVLKYVPDAKKVTVHVQILDSDDNDKVLKNDITVSDFPNQKVNLQQYLSQFSNYVLDQVNNKLSGSQLADYTITADADQTVKIYLKHKIQVSTQTRDIHRRIYVQDPVTKKNTLVQDQVVTAKRSHTQDLTDDSKSTNGQWAVNNLPAFDLSKYEKSGYTLSMYQVPDLVLITTNIDALKPADDGKYYVPDVVVTYTPKEAPATKVNVHLEFLDADNNNQQVKDPIVISAQPDQKVALEQYLQTQFSNYMPDSKLNHMNGSQLAPYTVTKDNDQTVKVYLRHKVSDTVQTRNIHRRVYIQDPVTKQNKLIADQVIKASRHHIQDLANPKLVNNIDWKADAFGPVDLSSYQKPGYKLSPSAVDGLTLNNAQVENLAADKDGSYHVQDVIISYLAQQVHVKLQFVDADNNNLNVGFAHQLAGEFGSSVDWTKQVQVPSGYDVDKAVATSVTFDKDKTITIALRHKKTPLPNDDAHKAVLNQQVSRTINFVDSETGKELHVPIVQHEDFTRQGWHDEVTGLDSFGEWQLAKTSTNSTKPQFDAVDLPTIDGYDLQKDQAVDAVSLDPNNLPQNSVINVKYDAKEVAPQKVTITFKLVDQTTNKEIGEPFTMSGKQGSTGDFLIGKLMIPEEYMLTKESQIFVTPIHFDQTKTVTLYVVPINQDVSNDPKYQTKTSFTRTVNFIGFQKDGKTITLAQPKVVTINAHRSATLNQQTGKVTYGNWILDQNAFPKEDVPSFDGWKLQDSNSKIDQVNVDLNKANIEQTINYVPVVSELNHVDFDFVMVDDNDANDPVMKAGLGLKPMTATFEKGQHLDIKDFLLKNGFNTQVKKWAADHPQYDFVSVKPDLKFKDNGNGTCRVYVHFKHHIQNDVQHLKATEEIQFVNGHGANLGHGTSLSLPITIHTQADLVSGQSSTLLTFDTSKTTFPAYNLKEAINKFFSNAKLVSVQTSGQQLANVSENNLQVPEVEPSANDYNFVVKVVLNTDEQPTGDQQSVNWTFVDEDDQNNKVGTATATGKIGSYASLDSVKAVEQKLFDAGYELAPDEHGLQDVKITDAKSFITIKLVHKRVNQTQGDATAQVIVYYKNADGSDYKQPDVQNLSVPMPGTFDLVTKQFTPNPDAAKLLAQSVTVDRAGYQAILSVQQNGSVDGNDLKSLDGQQIVVIPSFNAKNGSTTKLVVTYNADNDNQSVNKVIQFVTKDGQIVGQQNVTGNLNSAVSVDYQIPDGYHTLDGQTSTSLTLTDNSSLKVLVTKDGLSTVTKKIVFLDSDSRQIVGSQSVQGQTGTSSTIDLNLPEGYQTSNNGKTLKITFDNDGSITINVQKVQHDDTLSRDIVYVLNGTTIVGRQKVTGQKGQPMEISFAVPDGYHVVTGDSSILLPMNDTSDYQVAVDRTQSQTVITFVDDNGKRIGQQAVNGNDGEQGMIHLTLPDGFETTSGSNILNVVYGKPATVRVKKINSESHRDINFVNDKGDVISHQSVSGPTGTTNVVSLNVPTGYTTVSGQTQLPVSYVANDTPVQVAIRRDNSLPTQNAVTETSLPQTGNENTLGLVALGILTLGLGMSLLKDKKRE